MEQSADSDGKSNSSGGSTEEERKEAGDSAALSAATVYAKCGELFSHVVCCRARAPEPCEWR